MKQVETYAPPKENGKIMLNANELYCDLDEALRKEELHELSKLSFHRYPDETSKELKRMAKLWNWMLLVYWLVMAVMKCLGF